MAGFDPTGNAGAGGVTAKADLMRFTIDRNGSGTIGDAVFEDVACRARNGSVRIQSVRDKAKRLSGGRRCHSEATILLRVAQQ